MKDRQRIAESLVDVRQYPVVLGDIDTVQTGEVVERIARELQRGFCICYGAGKLLTERGFDMRADRERAYALLESLFRSALARIDTVRYSVTPHAMTVARMDVDGYNLNQLFSHDGQIPARAFMTNKLIHFDAATPFIANIYGPNDNIRGGHPLICDVRQFCADRGVDPAGLVDNIPNNYNVAVRPEPYDDLLADYSVAVDLDLENDIAVVMLLNEIAFGLAHGATAPEKRDAAAPAARPIRHIEMQFGDEAHYVEWYGHYRLGMLEARDYAGENLSLHYYGPPARPFDNLIAVPR